MPETDKSRLEGGGGGGVIYRSHYPHVTRETSTSPAAIGIVFLDVTGTGGGTLVFDASCAWLNA